MVSGGTIAGIAIFIVVLVSGVYAGLTYFIPYQVTLTVDDVKVIPAGSGGSHYIVFGKEGRNVEIQWNMWIGENRDNMLREAELSKGKPITFECSGWDIQWAEWYPLCGKTLE